MIDLSPQPQDKGTGSGAAHPNPTPRHDPLSRNPTTRKTGDTWWHLSHEKAEGAIQHLSRWAGPATLLATVALLGWWIIH